MNYSETIDYLMTRLPMFSRIGAAALKNDLVNTIALCQSLGNPQEKFKSVHVAGTNGKGSTSHMLAAVFQEAGYKTGLYTSPHLKDFRERIKINGEPVDKTFILEFVERIRPQIELLEPSFFEITVAMAFDYFARENVDIAIIEVGLGGRLDSTNIITPELAVITNISYDHMYLLGDTLGKIAAEKAGIIKRGVPVVIGESGTETKPVFDQTAAALEAPIYFADKTRFASDFRFEHHQLVVETTGLRKDEKEIYRLDLSGIYQAKNLVTVLQAVDLLQQQGWNISRPQLHKALTQVRKLTGLHGRWELIHRQPEVVIDVAHNEDGIRQLTRQIELTDHENLHIIIGLVKDKEVNSILSLLPKHAQYYFTRAQIPRALPEQELASAGHALSLQGKAYISVSVALQAAMNHANARDLIVVCGSVFIVGEVDLASVALVR